MQLLYRLASVCPSAPKWWVPPTGVTPGSLLAVLIPVPGGDIVWQGHAPVDRLAEKGIAFDPVSGEGASSHSEAAPGSSGGRGGGAESAKQRRLRAFEGLAGL
jgi:hypothetical protein